MRKIIKNSAQCRNCRVVLVSTNEHELVYCDCFIDVPTTNTGKVVGFLGNCTSTSLASTIRPIEIAPSANTSYMGLREDVCLWLLCTHTSAESIHYQEVKQ